RPFVRRKGWHSSSMGRAFSLLVCVCLMVVTWSAMHAQTREQLKQQAESQLQQMTPEQIEAKLKELGLTREEAVRRAEEIGIPLEQYLSRPGVTKEAVP